MTELISSLHNPRIKSAIRLRQRRGRLRQQRTLIDGVREVRRAWEAGVQLLEAYVCRTDSEFDEKLTDLRRELAHSSVELIEVTPAVFAKLAYGEREDGIIAIAQPPQVALEQLDLPENPLVCVLEGIEKPGNLGAIARSADAIGLTAMLLVDCETDAYNPNSIRASLGTVFALPVVSTTHAAAQRWLSSHQFQLFATRVDAELQYDQCDYSAATALIFGSEAWGLSSRWPEASPIALPMMGVADSLNVSATAAVLFYEALRQRSNR